MEPLKPNISSFPSRVPARSAKENPSIRRDLRSAETAYYEVRTRIFGPFDTGCSYELKGAALSEKRGRS